MVEQMLCNKGSLVQFPVKVGFSLIAKKKFEMNPGHDLNYHADTHLSDIL